ncbi:secY/secA suppressor protein [Raoultella terrigena]|uniref:SecY/secA suppressor protein n=1 Tax=Raoultella terrigena TaxID=577 RepID=A0A485B9K1_RAOTE|nr:secY/secA suppressor protein [Raoultella terrigena]
MPKDSVFYATLEEAIDAAREEYLANNPESDEESANVEQLNIQKYVLQDGDIAWQAEFFATMRGKASACRCSAAKRRRAFLTATTTR